MSYIVPNELPKTCNMCPYGHVIMQNPLSSKTPIKRYRCQVGEAPWKTFDVDFHDNEYKNKDCPLVPIERIMERLEEEGKLADEEKERCARKSPLQFDRAVGYSNGIYNAIKIIKEECDINAIQNSFETEHSETNCCNMEFIQKRFGRVM